ncbi:hypothetical protein CBER1_04976 [Cercospora berteroae]|uniref:Protein kinase domain-containing protein n=1 Tax=Cercospora berteroae TaxID=357750 RepID=A0A2S6BQX7_9PEZI|nr:hypothetical protein CBER1_04976 [Cercospora berteroae]
MDSFARAFQIPVPWRVRPRPQATLFGKHGSGTMKSRASIESSLRKMCVLPGANGTGRVGIVPPEQFVHIRVLLQMLDVQDGRVSPDIWSSRPRLYTLLLGIGALAYMDAFVKHSIYDISLPFDNSTLPVFLADAALRTSFLASQVSVITDARHLESSSEEHIYFDGSAEDHLISNRVLGHGGFGYVDVVVSRLSARAYARKRVARGRDSDDNRRAQQYVVDEIRLMKNLRHRHLTRIVQSYSDYKFIGFLMEPIAECNLQQFLSKRPFRESQLMALRQFYGCLAGGVNYLHQTKIRHRDLKLLNVLVKNSQVYIADFGIATVWTGSNRGTTQTRGVPTTFHYMAPEVDNKQSRNVASDMWSLDIVILEILTVLKGHTFSKWKDHLKKMADRARTDPWPCRNLDAVHEWMSTLATTQRHEGADDESLAWRDNEPLTWIKSLLEHNQDAFACPDCVEEFMDPHYRYGDGHEWPNITRDAIEAELAALVGGAAETPEQMDDRKTEMVTRWLGETQEHFDPWADEPRPFSIPGAYTDWCEERSPGTQISTLNADHRAISIVEEQIHPDIYEPASKQALHDGGFFVDHEDDSSDAASMADEPAETHAPGQLFPIVHDMSSDSSEDVSPIDLPMLDQIAEEDEEPCLSQSLSRPNEPSQAQTPEERVVRFQGAEVEEDNFTSTVGLWRAECALAVNGPVLGKNTPNGHDESRQQGQPQVDQATPAQDQIDVSAGLGTVVGEKPLEQDMNSSPLKTPSCSTCLPYKIHVKPPINVEKQLLLRWLAEPTPDPELVHLASESRPYGLSNSGKEGTQVVDLSRKIIDDSKGKSKKKSKHDAEAKEPSSEKLSAQNVKHLSREGKAKRRTQQRTFDDDDFTPAGFIEAAWQSVEATDSLATSSVMSETETASRKLRGFKLIWDDRMYSYLEHYAKAGRAGSVRFLLDHGCNCGTVLKPRPKPLIHAIEGCSARHNECVRAFIMAGTDVNVKYRCKTPIHVALEQSYFPGYQRLLAMLLAAGAEPNVPDRTGEYPLTKLFKGSAGDIPLEDYQKEYANVRQPFTLDTPLHQAVRRRTAQAVALLIHYGADVNAKNASGTTPLVMAASQWRGELTDQQERVLRYLLDAEDIDLDAKGGTLGRTASHHASATGCAVALDMLLESGADKSLQDKDGNTALTILEAYREAGAPAKDFQVMLDMLTE